MNWEKILLGIVVSILAIGNALQSIMLMRSKELLKKLREKRVHQ
jgi:hypothetical protein